MSEEIKGYPIEYVKSGEVEHDWERYHQLEEGDIFIEIGAFWGRYGIIASEAKCSKIILVEPSPINVATIQNLINKEPLNNVILIQKAISNKKGFIEFNIAGNPAGHSLLYGNTYVEIEKKEMLQRNKESNEKIIIEVDTIDNLLTDLSIDTVDLLSCDCEGEEIHLVEGAEKYLTEKRIKYLALATYHAPENHKIIMKMLEEKGYKDIKHENGIVYAHS